MAKIGALWTFIKSVGLPMLILTLANVYLVIANRSASPVFLFFWVKIIVDALLFYFWFNFRGHEIFYYYNLGIRKRMLFGVATIVDLTLFLILHLFILSWL